VIEVLRKYNRAGKINAGPVAQLQDSLFQKVPTEEELSGRTWDRVGRMSPGQKWIPGEPDPISNKEIPLHVLSGIAAEVSAGIESALQALVNKNIPVKQNPFKIVHGGINAGCEKRGGPIPATVGDLERSKEEIGGKGKKTVDKAFDDCGRSSNHHPGGGTFNAATGEFGCFRAGIFPGGVAEEKPVSNNEKGGGNVEEEGEKEEKE
jgi:hypothetical protein